MKNAYFLIYWLTTIIKVFIVSVSDNFWLFDRYIFKIVTTNLWKSDRPVSIVRVFWNNLGELVKKRSMHDGFSGFLHQADL